MRAFMYLIFRTNSAGNVLVVNTHAWRRKEEVPPNIQLQEQISELNPRQWRLPQFPTLSPIPQPMELDNFSLPGCWKRFRAGWWLTSQTESPRKARETGFQLARTSFPSRLGEGGTMLRMLPTFEQTIGAETQTLVQSYEYIIQEIRWCTTIIRYTEIYLVLYQQLELDCWNRQPMHCSQTHFCCHTQLAVYSVYPTFAAEEKQRIYFYETKPSAVRLLSGSAGCLSKAGSQHHMPYWSNVPQQRCSPNRELLGNDDIFDDTSVKRTDRPMRAGFKLIKIFVACKSS